MSRRVGKNEPPHAPLVSHAPDWWISNLGVNARDESRWVRVEPVVRCVVVVVVVVVAGKTRLGKRGKKDGFVVEGRVGNGWGRRHKVAEDDSNARRTR